MSERRAPALGSRVDQDNLRALRERGDGRARARLVERHLPLVKQLAWRFRASGEPLEDLVQSGCVGLVKAIDRYDPARGASLHAYAVPTIVGEIRRHLRDRGGGPFVPRPVRELGATLRTLGDELTTTLGRTPTIAELAAAAAAEPEAAVEALLATNARLTVPLSVEPDGSDLPPAALRAPDEAYEAVDDRAAAARALRVLDRRERTVIALSFFGELSQAQIGVRLGISQMHVSRLLRRALAKARAAADLPIEPAQIGS